MKILILGGTGAMGAHLVNLLSSKGDECFVTTRQKLSDKPNIHYIQGDAHQASCLFALLKNDTWDAIVDFMVYSTEEFKVLCPFFLSATNQYMFFSSGRVFADAGDKMITEESPRLLDVCKDSDYLMTDEYALAKARQEDILRSSNRGNWTIVRPYVTYAEYRLQLSCMEKEQWLWRALNKRSIVLAKPLAEKYTTFTYGHDVARGIASLIGNDLALGQAFNITGNEYMTWGEVLNIYTNILKEKTGCWPKVFIADTYEPYHGGGPLQVKYDRMYNRRFDNSKIARFIDTSTFTSVAEGLRRCLDVFIETPKFKNINWNDELKKDCLARDFVVRDIPGRKLKIKQVLKYFHIVK